MRVLAVAVFTLVALALAACGSDQVIGEQPTTTPCPPETTPVPSTREAQLAVIATPVGFEPAFEDLAAIADEVPGFAGMSTFRSPDILVVSMTSTKGVEVDELRAAIVSRFPDLASREIQFGLATFDYGQFDEWFPIVKEALLASPEVLGHLVEMRIDDYRNRILVGADSHATVRAAEREIDKLGLPPGAVDVELGPLTAYGCVGAD